MQRIWVAYQFFLAEMLKVFFLCLKISTVNGDCFVPGNVPCILADLCLTCWSLRMSALYKLLLTVEQMIVLL